MPDRPKIADLLVPDDPLDPADFGPEVQALPPAQAQEVMQDLDTFGSLARWHGPHADGTVTIERVVGKMNHSTVLIRVAPNGEHVEVQYPPNEFRPLPTDAADAGLVR